MGLRSWQTPLFGPERSLNCPTTRRCPPPSNWQRRTRTAPRALELLDRLLSSLTVPWDLAAAPLYPHLPTKDAVGEDQRALIPPILDSMERDPECAFLRETPGYAELIQRYRNEVT